jgi:hypothetical protein
MPTANPATRLYRNTRREAVLIAFVWLAALIWVVGYCYLRGYAHPADSWLVTSGLANGPNGTFDRLWGFPSWVLFGIVIPWVLASLVTLCFAQFIMADDDLGGEGGSAA